MRECIEYCMKVMNIISKECCKYVILTFPCRVMKYNPVSYVKKLHEMKHLIRAIVMFLSVEKGLHHQTDSVLQVQVRV